VIVAKTNFWIFGEIFQKKQRIPDIILFFNLFLNGKNSAQKKKNK
jgi:hypothetical protein